MKQIAIVLMVVSLFACGEAKKTTQPTPPSQQPKVTADERVERIALISMVDEAGEDYEGVHRTKISENEAKKVAQTTAIFLNDSAPLIAKGMQADAAALSHKAQTAFTILGMWPNATEMSVYGTCKSSLRNLARISMMRHAGHIATDANRSQQLQSVADSLVTNYAQDADSCAKLSAR